jgi:hypothetical protein
LLAGIEYLSGELLDIEARDVGVSFPIARALPKPVWELASIALTHLALPLLYYVFWGMLRLRPLHIMWSSLTWTRYFRRRFHDPETEQKGLH